MRPRRLSGDELAMEQHVQSPFHRCGWSGTRGSLIEEDHLFQAVKICRAIWTMPEMCVDRAADGGVEPKIEVLLDVMRNACARDREVKAAV